MWRLNSISPKHDVCDREAWKEQLGKHTRHVLQDFACLERFSPQAAPSDRRLKRASAKNRDTRKEDKRMTKDQKINLRGSDKYQNRRSSFDKRRLFHDQCGARVQISWSMWSESTNFMIKSGARVQKRYHYQREAESTINFPGSSNVRINQTRVVERTKMDEWRAKNKDWMEIQRERTLTGNGIKGETTRG